MHIREFIETFYPEYYSIESYPAEQVAPFCKIDAQWGIFSNFAHTPIIVNGFLFDTSERLFQVLKFSDEKARRSVYEKRGNPKMTAKHFEKMGSVRNDWGEHLVDAMKFCLFEKYQQNEDFRQYLQMSRGLYIVEDQTSFPKKYADTWGTKYVSEQNSYVGPNLLGRLLMELRDDLGDYSYNLPNDYLMMGL